MIKISSPDKQKNIKCITFRVSSIFVECIKIAKLGKWLSNSDCGEEMGGGEVDVHDAIAMYRMINVSIQKVRKFNKILE